MGKKIHILMLEDEAADVVRINHELRRAGLCFSSQPVETRKDFLAALQNHPPDLILLDHGLPSFDGMTALALAKEKCPEVPFIFVTCSMGEQKTIEMLESGATDYVLKSRLADLAPAVKRALHKAKGHKHMKNELRKSEALKTLILETALDAIILLDEEGKIQEWNPAAQKIFGYTREQAIGQSPDQLMMPALAVEMYPCGLADYLMTGAASLLGRYVETTLRRADGTEFTAELAASRSLEMEPSHCTVLVRDITERKQFEEELEQRVAERTAQLEAANKELEAFSYSISHDLRAPLLRISGFADILRIELAAKLDPKSAKYLKTITDGAQQMSSLIDALLDFSRKGRAELRQEMVNMDQLVEEAQHELRRDLDGRSLEWRIGHLPDARGDPIMLRQVLINLLSNALKYSRSRQPAVIEIGAETKAAETVYFVRDNGVGFDMAYAGKLFGVFQRLHPAREFEGTGIGLANVQRIIRRHGGQAWATGGVDEGATFYFSLPNPEKGALP